MQEKAKTCTEISVEDLNAFLSEGMDRAKKKKIPDLNTYNKIYKALKLDPTEGRTIRGVRDGSVGIEKKKIAYERMCTDKRFDAAPLCPRSLYGFSAPYVKNKKQEDTKKYEGIYVGIGVSTLSQKSFVLHILELHSKGSHLFARIRTSKSNMSSSIDEGHGYFVKDQLYIFCENIDDPEEILTTALNKESKNVIEVLFGIYLGLGTTGTNASHPAAARIAYIKISTEVCKVYDYTKIMNDVEEFQKYAEMLNKRWVLESDIKKSGFRKDVIDYVTSKNLSDGDYALRTGKA